MEARISAVVCCALCLSCITGCWANNAGPGARPTDQKNVEPVEPPQVVDATTSDVQQAAAVEPEWDQVQRWIDRIQRRDDLHSRVTAADSPPYDPQFDDGYPEYSEPVAVQPEPDAQTDASKRTVANEPPQPAVQEETPVMVRPAAEPPRLVSVSARAGQRAEQAPIDSRPSGSGGVNSPAVAAVPSGALNELLEQYLDQPGDISFQSQLDKRLLQVVAGNYELARLPLDVASDAQQEMAAQLVEAMIAMRETHGGEPDTEAGRVIARIDQLRESLASLAELSIPRLELTRSVRGFGQFTPFDPPHFPSGRQNEFVVYCELANFVSEPTSDGGFEARFGMKTAVMTRQGDVVLELNDDQIEDRCQTRRRDCFISCLVRLPASLSPGEYVVKVTIVDKIGQKVSEKRVTFRITARS